LVLTQEGTHLLPELIHGQLGSDAEYADGALVIGFVGEVRGEQLAMRLVDEPN
jgi:hypothetical protein